MNKNILCFGVLVGALLVSGCSIRRLKTDLKKVDTLKPIAGSATNASSLESPVVVALWSLSDKHLSGYWVTHGGGDFSFLRDSGRYYLFAFEDTNEDGYYQKNERLGLYADGAEIDLDKLKKGLVDVRLTLLPLGKVSLPAPVLTLSNEQIDEKFSFAKSRVGEITDLNNPLFTAQNASVGLWEPLRFFKEIGMKIYFTEAYNPDKTPILFVHGSRGHPKEWEGLVAELDPDKFQLWFAYYPSGVRLDKIGEILSRNIIELKLRHGFEEMIVVAHSMGGLVARSMILKNASYENRCDIPVFISIATPWAGHGLAAKGVKYASAVVPSWYDMVPGSPFLNTLFESSLSEETEHHLFFAYRGKSGIKMTGKNTDGTVSLASQLFMPAQNEAEKLYGIDAGHVDILSNRHTLNHLDELLNKSF